MATISVISSACLFSCLFIGAALGKIDAWRSWRELWMILMPRRRLLRRIVAVSVPFAEFSIAVVVIADPRHGLLGAALLLVIFTVFALVANNQYKGVSCNCFGAMIPSQIGPALVLRNLAATGLAGSVAYVALTTNTSPSPGVDALLLTFALFVIGLLIAELRRLARFIDPARNQEAR
jgi:hypothetical protein